MTTQIGMLRHLPVLLLVLPLGSSAQAQDNVLFILADDIGVDRIAAYGEHPDPGRTPNIDRLAASGVLFRNCWSNPMCSPTRATVMTGRYSFRTGIGGVDDSQPGLKFDEWTLPEVLMAGTAGACRTACIGKWHLAGLGHSPWHPNAHGFEHFAGSIANLGYFGGDYYHWEKVVNGSKSQSQTYATTDVVDETLDAIASFGTDRWFVWVAFQAAHEPYHRPPPWLHGYVLDMRPEQDTPLYHKAMVEALDTELGRLLAGIEPEVLARTTIVFLGDNGTQNPATELPFIPGHGKGALYEGGVNVPLIVTGHGVSAKGSECTALVNTTDLFATLAELAGVRVEHVVPVQVTLDSQSLVPYLTNPELPSQRRFVFAERFMPNHAFPKTVQLRAARSDRYKLIVNVLTGVERFFDLADDPFERDNLLLGVMTQLERRAHRNLQRWIAALVSTG